VYHPQNSSWDELANILANIDRSGPLAFDIETFAHTITCVGVSWTENEALVVPFTEVPEWTLGQRTDLIMELAEILADGNPKIGQNLDYDVQHLAQIGIGVSNVWLDTAVAHSILYPEIPHDLAMLTSIYTLQPYFKEMRKEVETDQYDEAQWTYNGLDCCVTYEIGMKLAAELKEKSQ
jgi:DNA polymerase I-like protein with 3'-5' exonuclease and polymerase domains